VSLDIHEEPLDLTEYAKISIAYLVDRVFDIATPQGGIGGIALAERPVDYPYVKDYDALRGERPTRWSRRFDLSGWGMIAGLLDGERVGGAVIAFDPSGAELLEGRADLAILWDIRVSPERRGVGIGRSLFEAAERWAQRRECTQMLVETQNINVAACRFYAAMGCELRSIDRFAYPEFPEEAKLCWRREI
jgi:GNAT superfamily N-acetyltransferase